jgi:peptide/nickel transport system permease protein
VPKTQKASSVDNSGKKIKKIKTGYTAEAWRRLKQNKVAYASFYILVAFVLIAVFANFIAPYSYSTQDLVNILKEPSLNHLFGTDQYGRDIFSRVLYGARISVSVGFIAVVIALLIGSILGSIAGFYGKKVDSIIMRCMDILLSIPSILLALAIVATFGTSVVNLMIATGISTVPSYARLVRASILSIKDQEFVEAARAVGTNDFEIIIKHILPNCLAPILVQTTFGVATAILTVAGLSFVGLGLQPPIPEWGFMLSDARNYIREYSYMMIFPAIAIALTVFSLNSLGDGLRDALDPKLRN